MKTAPTTLKNNQNADTSKIFFKNSFFVFIHFAIRDKLADKTIITKQIVGI